MRYHYRCGKASCRERVILTEAQHKLVADKLCRCGGKLHHDPSVKKRSTQLVCRCTGFEGGWPHRIGTEPWCDHAEKGPTDADFEERYSECGYA